MVAFDTEGAVETGAIARSPRLTWVVGTFGYPRGGGGGMAKSAADARGDQAGRQGTRHRVLLRAVRRPVRPAEREARAGREPRRPRRARAPASPGFAAGEIGQVPSDPDIAAMPDLDSFTPVPWQPNLARFACDITVEGEPWPYCPRTILRTSARAREGARLRVQDRARARVLPRPRAATTARSRSPTPYDTLEKPCYDMAGPDAPVRLPHHRLEVLQRARLGQLRERPRGRERAVRAELHLRRRARQLRPRDLLPLHGPHARRAARDDRDLHAEAVHAA